MKIAYVSINSLAPYDSSGAEKTIDELLDCCSREHDVLALATNEKYLLQMKEYSQVVSDAKCFLKSGSYNKIFWHNIEALKNNFGIELIKFKPDIILMQLCDIEFVVEWIIKTRSNTHIVFYFHGDPERDVSHIESLRRNKNYVSYIICVSSTVRNKLPDDLKKMAYVLSPLFFMVRNVTYIGNGYDEISVISYNTTIEKGFPIVEGIAERIPNLNFHVYKTWHNVLSPFESHYKNISVMNYEMDITKIFKGAFLYILPSQKMEGYGRGIVEAGAFGVPCLASKVPGIESNIYDEELLVEHFDSVEEWVKYIEKLKQNRDLYTRLSHEARNFSCEKMKEADVQFQRFMKMINNI